MTDALDRIRARAEAHTAAVGDPAPVQPPPEPVADPAQGDLASQVADLNETVTGLSERLGVLEQAAVDDAMADLDGWVDEGAMAALPAPIAAAE